MNRNLTIRMGNCNHRRYLPCLVGLVQTSRLEPEKSCPRASPLRPSFAAPLLRSSVAALIQAARSLLARIVHINHLDFAVKINRR